MGNLGAYRTKRDFSITKEPAGTATVPVPPPVTAPAGAEPEARRFVIQEHHARRLHWDFRLEKDGVLVSWAVPRGVPADPKRNHLAVHVEDHPIEYGSFEGAIPAGEYGAGRVSIWDSGTYETHKWRMGPSKGEVMVTLHGRRLTGRYVLFQTGGENWMIHRMDPPADPDYEPMPREMAPMLARAASRVPTSSGAWAYEFKWDGIRALAYSDGGTLRLLTRAGEDVTARYPELRGISDHLGSHSAVLDGEIVALGDGGRPDFELLQTRMALTSPTQIRRRAAKAPVAYLIFDLLYLDGHRLTARGYEERRRRLESLGLAGAHWQVPPYQTGAGADVLAAAEQLGLEGIVAKRLGSRYEAGDRSGAWLKVKHRQRETFVVGGWTDGTGRRSDLPGALLVGQPRDHTLLFAGRVGSGFTDRGLNDLAARLAPLAQAECPFDPAVMLAGAHWVRPDLVVEVDFSNRTREGRLRAPSFKGVVREPGESESAPRRR